MRYTNLILSLFTAGFLFSLTSCEKETEELALEPVSDYLPVAIGKYITYRLDSTVFPNIGRNVEIHRYQVKHVVDAQVTDNLGRPSFRILRYLRDSIGTQPWVNNGTYFITPLADQVEVIEDNLRFIKVHFPLKLNNDWKGNKYLSSNPYESVFTFNNDDGMDDWDYNIEEFDEALSIGGQTINKVYTIFHIDELSNAPVSNPPVINPAVYGSRTLSTERFAKDIGMVSRDYVLWDYQPPINGQSGFYTGFGIKMWMIDHN